MAYDLTHEVSALGSINFEGNIIPMEWFANLKLDTGKPDTISILLLSDIIYWYRPTTIREEFSGKIIGYRKKFKADLLQRGYKDFETLFGYSRDQIKDSLQRLEKKGFIKRIFRNISNQSATLSNVMFIQIFPNKIIEITNPTHVRKFPHTSEEISSHLQANFPTPLGINPHTYTETTTEITTNNSLSSKKRIDKTSATQISNFEREKEMIKIWDKVIRENEKPSLPNKSRLMNLKNILDEYFENNLVNWENYCFAIKKSKFLMGGGVNNWKADLTWAIKQDNLIRVQEGYYHKKEEQMQEEKKSEVILEKEEICTDPAWKDAKEKLKKEKGEGSYKAWFSKLRFSGYDRNKLLLTAPTKFVREWVMSNYKNDILALFSNSKFKIQDLEILVEDKVEVIV
jgi:hypothetical protein